LTQSRAQRPDLPPKRDDIGLPARPFLFTLDQISVLLDISERKMIASGYVYLEGRSVGIARRDMMIARNIAPATERPDWRVAERELIRWFKRKGFKYYDRGSVTH
jgi:hypothetical protein